MARARIRDLGIIIGELPTGEHNAITDVPGVQVGHATLIEDTPHIIRTGVTIVMPQPDIWERTLYGATHVFNGNGEMTGLPWIAESGQITSPIGITNTHQVGLVRDTLVAVATENSWCHDFLLPIVSETWDGFLNDIDRFALTQEHVRAALAAVSGGPVAEGCVGGGTGMICHGFKGGIGTASRVAAIPGTSHSYTVGALVQANYGRRRQLRVDGVPVGRLIGPEHTPLPWDLPKPQPDGSIVVIVATDAPLLPDQCRRLAQRATVGLARVGGVGYNSSGDLFLAFATGNRLSISPDAPFAVQSLPGPWMDHLFDATAESVEEAILNALTMAETTAGIQGRTAHAIPLDALQELAAGRWATPSPPGTGSL